ncbi:MAG: ribosome small subunit-dependent GTPase A [Clostridia bacterium]|nr:ribosome small subunit-dependent GTPase A [Clostridia bacterium]
MPNKAIGTILKGVGGLYAVRLTASPLHPTGTLLSCRARGSFRHEHTSPLPGDTVTVLCPDEPISRDIPKKKKQGETSGYVIDEIHPRRNALIRPPVANLSYLFITMAAAAPEPILTTIDKLIAIAEFNRIEPVIVITKNELHSAYAGELSALYTRCGFTCFSVSAVSGEGISLLDGWIKEHLPGKIAAFAGASGIGKSTLMNRLFPHLSLSTSEISRKIERGRHTTRQVELFPLSEGEDCGYIADTPGFSMLDFERFDFFEKDDLPETMREFVPYIGGCRYTKCSHTKEDGCAILQAVREGIIPPSRHASYLALYEVLKNKKKWN